MEAMFELEAPNGYIETVFKSSYKDGDTYQVYIFNDIGHPDEYIKGIRALDVATEADEVHIYIGSNGGMLDTAMALIEHIRNCKARTIAKVSFAASAATIIALVCDKIQMYPHGYFMMHNFSAGSSGKGAELKARAQFEDMWSKRVFEDLYKGFLSDDEIEALREDKDFWLVTSQVNERLELIGKLFK